MSFRVLAIDPGAKVGMADTRGAIGPIAWTCPLANLPHTMRRLLGMNDYDAVVVESYSLRPHQARQQSGSDMPAPQGVGMVRAMMYDIGAPLYLLPPSCKAAGRASASKDILEALALAGNDHERDALDLAAYALREHNLGRLTCRKQIN